MVAGGGLAAASVGGLAHADAGAGGSAQRSPGLLSGNVVQLPVHAPVNVCGNTVSVVGLLNSAAGNRCANAGPGEHPDPRPSHPSGPSSATGPSRQGAGHGGGAAGGGGALAEGRGKDSPGLLSGNGIQLPIDLPVNISGNAVSVVGVGNSATGNTSVNTGPPSGSKPAQPPVAVRPVTPPAPPRETGPALAHTGADGLGYLIPGSAALLLGGALLYRRSRSRTS
ncbi:chaplin [Streptomyces sp. NPDC098789]|uniref:chaplin n=1 Tax=Streptomyces sp. NPDC098789 TaxID=3366098 RepID=UPI0038023B80